MIRLIGALALQIDGSDGQRPVQVDLGPLGQAAFGYLVIERRRKVPHAELAEILWGEALPATWRAALRGVISRLRNELESVGLDGLEVVASRSGNYQLHLPGDPVVDVEALASSIRAAEAAVERGDPVRARALAGHVMQLSEGQFLPGATGDWVEHRRARVQELHVRSLELLSESAALCGDYPVALQSAESAVHLAPLRESAHLRVMMAHASSGNRAEALQAYQRCRQVLADEIGVLPGPQIEAARLRLLSDDGIPSGSHTDQRPATDLPASVDSFVGRTKEISSIKRWLASSRLVTLTGPPGVGKSRLSREVARDLSSEYPDGIYFLELTDVASLNQLAGLILTTLAENRARRQDSIESLIAVVGDRRLLLLLDNCEHLVSSCARLVDALLREAPNLRVLATSREPFEAAGEVVWEVPPLSIPGGRRSRCLEDMLRYEAVRLFLDRARSVAPDLEADPVALAQVCDRLDGLPLAIELAAARARTLALGEMARRLDDRFRLLASGDHVSTSRRHTLGAALDWSYERLDEDERALLAGISVFVGGFSLDAVESLCSDCVRDVLDVLSNLVKKSFVAVQRRASANRYHLLETIRDYASQRLRASGEEATVRGRHAEWVAQLARSAADKLDGPDQAASFQLLQTEHGNVTAALQWLSSVPHGRETGLRVALSIWRFWELDGHLKEGRLWLENLAASRSISPPLRADALNSAAILAHHQSDNAGARRLYRQSLAIRRDIGDELGVAAAVNGLAHLDVSEGAYAEAKRKFEENLLVAEGLGKESLSAATLMNLGVVEQLLWTRNAQQRSHTCERARLLLEQARARFISLGNIRGAAQCLENLGSLALLEGSESDGRSHLGESLATRRALSDKLGIAECVRFLGQSALEQDAYQSSRKYFEECAALWRRMGNKRRTAEVLTSLAKVADAQGDSTQAKMYLRESLRLYCELADEPAADRVLEQLQEVAR